MISQIVIYYAVLVCVGGVEMEIGNMIDLFRNYGLLTRIFPIDANHDEFMQIEFSENIFNKRPSKCIISNTDRLPRNGSWQVEAHENIGSVLRSILNDYKIDLVEHVEKAFAASYARKSIAGFFGINHFYLLNHRAFVLVKYVKTLSHFELLETAIENPTLDAKIMNAIENITIGDTAAVLRFISKFGSHYLASFSNGELIYQIFAVPQSRYACLAQLEKIHTFEDTLKCVHEYEMSPSEIKTLTNVFELEDRLNRQYRRHKHKFSNLFLMKQDPNFMSHLDQFQNFVTTGINLKSVADAVSEPKSTFIREVISNHMTLREEFLQLF